VHALRLIDYERWYALQIALHVKSGNYGAAGAMAGDSPRTWHLVGEALEDHPKFEPTPIRFNIIEAYYAATFACVNRNGGINLDGIDRPEDSPTVAEVKAKFIESFGKQKLPTDWTIRKTLKALKLSLRKDEHRGPRGPWSIAARENCAARRRERVGRTTRARDR
jgi:hypothetical protein